jgi:hypothetical protein
MPVADAVDVNRWDRRAAPLGQRQLLPAGLHPVGGRPEVPVEAVLRVDRADDRVHRYGLQAQVLLAAPAERANDLAERHDAVTIPRVTAQPVPQCGQDLAPPRPQKVVLHVCLWKSGVQHDRHLHQ